jgi:ComF family protein
MSHYSLAGLLKSLNGIVSVTTDSVLHLFFPHICAGCNTDLLDKGNMLCLHCLASLPQTHFHLHSNNPMEKLFWGRLPIAQGSAQYYFSKESLVQRLMHHFKYKGNKELGHFLGKLMGHQLAESNRFSYLDAIIPLPLFPSKEKRRGFNQAAILCEGISEVLQIPVLNDVVRRTVFTGSQTKKNRLERWQNMEGRFEVVNAEVLKGRQVLLVDDVVTTGATLEACGHALLAADAQLSVAALCFSSQ